MLIKELIFPRRCPVCDRIVPWGKEICIDCIPWLVKVKGPRCYKCGKPIHNQEQEYCYDCYHKKHDYDSGMALYEYQSVCQSIIRFKYKNRAEYADYYGKEMAKLLGRQIKNWRFDAILAVPLHKKRQNIRGYNQADLLARVISKSLEIPYYPKLIVRKRKTIPLKELDPKGRQINLKNAFIIKADDVKLNRVVIVDDIYTTGSTIDEIAGLLKKNGVSKVYFITLATGKGL